MAHISINATTNARAEVPVVSASVRSLTVENLGTVFVLKSSGTSLSGSDEVTFFVDDVEALRGVYEALAEAFTLVDAASLADGLNL